MNTKLNVLSLFSGIGGMDLGFEQAKGFRTVAMCDNNQDRRADLTRLFPGVKVYEDVSTLSATRLQADGIPRPDVICGGFPCFPKGTLILAKHGLVDISEIVEGDEVWTHNNRWRRVAKAHGSHEASTIRLRGHGHPNMVTTPNHPFLSVSKTSQSTRREGKPVRISRTSEPSWIDASNMAGKFWASPINVTAEMPSMPSRFEASCDLFWCLGRWLADGWTVTHPRISKIPPGNRGSRINSVATRVHWCCANEEANEVHARLVASGINPSICVTDTVTKFVIQSSALGSFLEQFGKYAHGKTIPAWLLGAPVELRSAFLDGYRTGDGNERDNGWQTTTVSKPLAVGIRLLAISLGWSVACHHTSRKATCIIEGRTVNQRDTWQLVAGKQSKCTSSFVSSSGHRFGLVRSVEATGDIQTVYNFEVEDDQSYIADGICVHNCQDISVARGASARGLDGDRSGLWFEYARLIEETQPDWIVIENSPRLRHLGLETILRFLHASGYDAFWDGIPARAVGAYHQRDRLFIVANRNGAGLAFWQGFRSNLGEELAAIKRDAISARLRGPDQPGMAGTIYDVPPTLDKPIDRAARAVWKSRLHALGNSCVPAVCEAIGRAIMSVDNRFSA